MRNLGNKNVFYVTVQFLQPLFHDQWKLICEINCQMPNNPDHKMTWKWVNKKETSCCNNHQVDFSFK